MDVDNLEMPVFDPSKKKKKKKMPVALEAALNGEVVEAPAAPTPEPTETSEEPSEAATGTSADAAVDVDIDVDFGMMKKKKKKKKGAFDMEEMDAALPSDEKAAEPAEEAVVEDMGDLGDMDFSLPTKKKKKKKGTVISDIVKAAEAGDGESNGVNSSGADVEATREFTYAELLSRAYDIMREKNPELVADKNKKINVKPPHVVRAGAKKSAFVNFADICRQLHRTPKHMLAFLLAELGTSGSVDGSNQLILKGRFQPKQMETVLRTYIKEYVSCHTCLSPDTILQKDGRLHFMQCERCGSRCSVASIKSGFQAVTGKRSVLRAKTN